MIKAGVDLDMIDNHNNEEIIALIGNMKESDMGDISSHIFPSLV